MEDQKRFWIILAFVFVVYGGYLAFSMGYFTSGSDTPPAPVKSEITGAPSSAPEHIQAFVDANVNLVDISMEISQKQTQFSTAQAKLYELGFNELDENERSKAVEDALIVVDSNEKLLNEIIELNNQEDYQINDLATLVEKLVGPEGQAARDIVVNLKKQNYFKAQYFIESQVLLNQTQWNLLKVRDNELDGLVELDHSQAKGYLMNQINSMDDAKKAAEQFKAIMSK